MLKVEYNYFLEPLIFMISDLLQVILHTMFSSTRLLSAMICPAGGGGLGQWKRDGLFRWNVGRPMRRDWTEPVGGNRKGKEIVMLDLVWGVGSSVGKKWVEPVHGIFDQESDMDMWRAWAGLRLRVPSCSDT